MKLSGLDSRPLTNGFVTVLLRGFQPYLFGIVPYYVVPLE
jgi:hypothetical protein